MGKVLLVDIPSYIKTVPDAYSPTWLALAKAEQMVQQRLLIETQQIHDATGKYSAYSRALLQLAAVLIAEGHAVVYLSVMDRNFWATLANTAGDFDMVGVTCMTASYHVCKSVCKAVREQNSTAIIVAGGYHVSYLAEEVLRENPAIDVVMRGDGDQALPLLIKNYPDWTGIPNISYRDSTDAIQHNPDGHIISMNHVPPLAFEVLSQPIERYFHNLITARGCKYECAYCVDAYLPLRFAKVDRTIQELQYLQACLPRGQFVYFADNVFSSNRRRMIELARAIAVHVPNLRFGCELRAEDIDDEVIQELVAAGFVWFSTAIEDSNDSTLEISRRNVAFEASIRGLETMRRYSKGLINVAWVTGLPGSTRTTLEHNIDKARTL